MQGKKKSTLVFNGVNKNNTANNSFKMYTSTYLLAK